MTEILTTLADGALCITLNRPDRLNAVTDGMWAQLHAALDRADSDDAVRAVILTGAGKAFCAGLDISAGAEAFGAGARPGEITRGAGGKFALRVFDCTKPVIAAINGAAAGVGVTMTLPADIRIASTEARFGFVFTRRGIIPEACSTWFLPRLVGIQRALDWTYSGRMVSAAEVCAGGLLLEIVPPEELMPRARAIAGEIARFAAPVSVTVTRQMMWRLLGADHPMEAHKLEARAMAALRGSPDAREGVAAFKEKRDPVFSMRPSADMPGFYPWWEERRFE